MNPHFSLKSVSVAILMFAVTVAMHEASRADHASQAAGPFAAKLIELPELLRPAM